MCIHPCDCIVISWRVSVSIRQKGYVSTLRIAMKGFRKRAAIRAGSQLPMWRKAGTIISRRLLPFSFRVTPMLSRGGKSLRRDHCAPTRSHDRRIATHRRRVLCVVGVTGTVEIFIDSSLLLRYISELHWPLLPPRLEGGVRWGFELTRG